MWRYSFHVKTWHRDKHVFLSWFFHLHTFESFWYIRWGLLGRCPCRHIDVHKIVTNTYISTVWYLLVFWSSCHSESILLTGFSWNSFSIIKVKTRLAIGNWYYHVRLLTVAPHIVSSLWTYWSTNIMDW